jgi:transposase-like protein
MRAWSVQRALQVVEPVELPGLAENRAPVTGCGRRVDFGDAEPTIGGGCRPSLSTTNTIENLTSLIRRVTRNVKRWRNGSMVRCSVGLGVAHAQTEFRRIKGQADLPALMLALKEARIPVADRTEAA